MAGVFNYIQKQFSENVPVVFHCQTVRDLTNEGSYFNEHDV